MKIVRDLAAVLMIVFVAGAVVGCAGNSQTDSTGEYVDDTVISSKVRAEIIGDEQLSIFDIDVETFKGDVQLSGFVDSEAMKERAGTLARNVKGVNTVHNNLVVK
jgi:osmotically-inducible protein OsmY